MRKLFVRIIGNIKNIKCPSRTRLAAFSFRLWIIQNWDIQLAVSINQASVALFNPDLFFPKNFPRIRIHSAEVAFFAHHKNTVTDKDRRAGGCRKFVGPKFGLPPLHNDRPRSRIDSAVSQGLSILAGLALGGSGVGVGKRDQP